MPVTHYTVDRRQQILECIPESGITLDELAAKLGIKRDSAEVRIASYIHKGWVHVCRAKTDADEHAIGYYFTDVDSRDEFREKWQLVNTARRKARDVAKLEKLRARVVVKKPKTTLVTKGTRVEEAPKAVGPARINGPLDVSRAKVTKAAAPVGRFDVPADFKGSFASAGIGSWLPASSCAARALEAA